MQEKYEPNYQLQDIVIDPIHKYDKVSIPEFVSICPADCRVNKSMFEYH